MRTVSLAVAIVPALFLAGCVTPQKADSPGVKPMFTSAVTDNNTPYSQCLASWNLAKPQKLPTFSVGEIADKTGQVNLDNNGHALSQGVSEMVMSAFYKTRMINLVERLDLRIPLAEVKLAEQKRLNRPVSAYDKLPASDYIVVGAVTELNYNIVSGGVQLFIQGIGGGGRSVIVNVALDLRVVDARNFSIKYVTSLQKQIYGFEVEANVFRFFGNTLVEFDAGKIKNEPMQLALRSVAEMSVYQIMTDFLGLPMAEGCAKVENDHMSSYLKTARSDKGVD
jgi:curli biogenesis system outer membrane secretion channel CsgG